MSSADAVGVHERSAGRVNHRNGYRPRRWETRAGTVDVQNETAQGDVFPGVSGTTPGFGESNDRGDPGSQRSGRLNAIMDDLVTTGHDGRLQEPYPDLRGDRTR